MYPQGRIMGKTQEAPEDGGNKKEHPPLSVEEINKPARVRKHVPDVLSSGQSFY
jgi:hypothetical protein